MSRRVLAWVSGGAASIIAARLALKLFCREHVVLVRCETGNEDEDNLRFEKECEAWLGMPVTVLQSDKYSDCWDVWTQRRYMAGINGAPCTLHMKVEPRLTFQRPDDVHVFGYTNDALDIARFAKLRETYFELDIRAPLIEQHLNKAATLQLVENAGIDLPRSYRMGFPNANCLKSGCVKASSPDYWSLYRHHFPERFARTAAFSREIGARLVRINGERRFLDELPANWPMARAFAPACDFLCQIAEQEMNEAA